MKLFVVPAFAANQFVCANCGDAASKDLKTKMAIWHLVFISESELQVKLVQ
jgi:hypothetical protein